MYKMPKRIPISPRQHEKNMMVVDLMADIANKFSPEQMGPELAAKFTKTIRAIFIEEQAENIVNAMKSK